MRTRILALIATFSIVTFNVFCQFNIAIGYDLSYVNPDIHNTILSTQNQNAQYEEGFKELHFLNGITGGGRYEMEGVALEVNFSTKLATRQAKNPLSVQSTDIKNRINYSFHSISLGTEGMMNDFGIGASVDYNFLRMKMNFDEPSLGNVFQERSFGHKLFLTFHLRGGGNTKLAIRPFAQFYWTPWDQGDIDQILNESSYVEQPEKFNNYGLSLIFLNGN